MSLSKEFENGLAEIHRAEYTQEDGSYRHTNFSKLKKQVLAKVGFNLVAVYKTAFNNCKESQMQLAQRVFHKYYYNLEFVKKFYTKKFVIIFTVPDIVILIGNTSQPSEQDHIDLASIGLIYEDINWEVKQIRDVVFDNNTGKTRRKYQ